MLDMKTARVSIQMKLEFLLINSASVAEVGISRCW
jgi:hypothetical protein